jgi:hypothetical protein
VIATCKITGGIPAQCNVVAAEPGEIWLPKQTKRSNANRRIFVAILAPKQCVGTNGGVGAPRDVVIKRCTPSSRVEVAEYVPREGGNTIRCVDTACGVFTERLKPNGCVFGASVGIERLKTDGRVVIAYVVIRKGAKQTSTNGMRSNARLLHFTIRGIVVFNLNKFIVVILFSRWLTLRPLRSESGEENAERALSYPYLEFRSFLT